MKNKLQAWGVAVAMGLPWLASAQASKPPSQLNYQSAFGDYKPYKDIAVGNWRAVNDAVGGVAGGSSGHAGHGMSGMKGMPDMTMPAASSPAMAMPMPMTMPMPMPMHEQAGHPMPGSKR